MFYQGTIPALRIAINEHTERCQKCGSPLFDSILYTADMIEKLNPASLDDAIEAAQLIGWIAAIVEITGIWDRKKLLEMINFDEELGFHKPH
jgi:hypothetical protein